MQARESALEQWLIDTFSNQSFKLTSLAGDASFRRYFRVIHKDKTYVVMDAPPSKEDIIPFIDINDLFTKNLIHVPHIYAINHSEGFMLLEDFGDQLLLNIIGDDNADQLYKAAIKSLHSIQRCSTPNSLLKVFDHRFMLAELSLFYDWFVKDYLNISLTTQEKSALNNSSTWLVEQIAQQPYVTIHRDYHSRNLIITQSDPLDIGIIDFQDAMHGPLAYDLASLLKDCYIQWPRAQVLEWISYFHADLPDHLCCDLSDLIRWFDLCGLQRHLKVLGIFCRLAIRDNKKAYLQNLPVTFNYIMDALNNQPELHELYLFMTNRIQQTFWTKEKL
ncbi:MAG: aminoglycoside phosphotransferase family protein [Legionella sp.]